MRQVFSSHSEVCHIWAQQIQPRGRAGNIFFGGPTIYSYGYHYKAAQFHKRKGQTFVLVNSYRYSPSTCKHLNEVRDAIRHLDYFESPDVTDPTKAIKHLDTCVQTLIDVALKRVKITCAEDIRNELNYITKAFNHANRLRRIVGRKELAESGLVAKLVPVSKHLNKRLDSWNSPDKVEKREAERREREFKEACAKVERAGRLQEAIQNFRQGGATDWVLSDLDHDLIRLSSDGKEIETSRHARVPIEAAKRLYFAIKSGNWSPLIGQRVGHYTVDGIYPHRNMDLTETVEVTIGCHKILMSEAARIFDRPSLTLVQGSA